MDARFAGTDAVLFDLDGVLVDTRATFAASLNAALAAHGLPERPVAELQRYLGPPLHETMAVLVDDDEELIESCVAAYRSRAIAKAAEESALFDGIAPVVEALAATRPVAVATSKPQALAEPLLHALGLAAPFTAIVGPALDVRHETKATTIGRALAHLPAGCSPAMVGDRRHDVVGAHAHGLRCIGVLWGVGDEAELRAAGAAALAKTPADLLTLLR